MLWPEGVKTAFSWWGADASSGETRASHPLTKVFENLGTDTKRSSLERKCLASEAGKQRGLWKEFVCLFVCFNLKSIKLFSVKLCTMPNSDQD